jgi:hypothetical protein
MPTTIFHGWFNSERSSGRHLGRPLGLPIRACWLARDQVGMVIVSTIDRFPLYLTIGLAGAIETANVLGRFETALFGPRWEDLDIHVSSRTVQQALENHRLMVETAKELV